MPKTHRLRKLSARKNLTSNSSSSLWPPLIRRLFETLREIPWGGLTVLSGLFGGSVLFAYFRSIDFFPTDFESLIGLTTAVAFAAMIILLSLALSFSASALLYRMYMDDEQRVSGGSRRLFSAWELVVLQLGALGAFVLLFVGWIYEACQSVSLTLLIACMALVLISLVSWGRIALHQGTWQDRLRRGYMAFLIAFVAMYPLVVLYGLRGWLGFANLQSIWVVLGMWGFVVVFNAVMATRLPGASIFSITLVLIVLLVFQVSLLHTRQSVFPASVANMLGMRTPAPVNLLVSNGACDLLRSASRQENAVHELACSSPWNPIKAQVLSRVGEHWLLELSPSAEKQGEAQKKVRVTVPGTEVQLIRELATVESEQVVCARGDV